MVQMDASLLLYHVRQGGFSSCALLVVFLFSLLVLFLFLQMRTGV